MQATSSAIGKTRFHARLTPAAAATPVAATPAAVIPAAVATPAAAVTPAVAATPVAVVIQLLQIHADQATLVSKLSLTLIVHNSSIAGTDRNKVTQLHAQVAHSSMKFFRSVTGQTKLPAQFEQQPD